MSKKHTATQVRQALEAESAKPLAEPQQVDVTLVVNGPMGEPPVNEAKPAKVVKAKKEKKAPKPLKALDGAAADQYQRILAAFAGVASAVEAGVLVRPVYVFRARQETMTRVRAIFAQRRGSKKQRIAERIARLQVQLAAAKD